MGQRPKQKYEIAVESECKIQLNVRNVNRLEPMYYIKIHSTMTIVLIFQIEIASTRVHVCLCAVSAAYYSYVNICNNMLLIRYAQMDLFFHKRCVYFCLMFTNLMRAGYATVQYDNLLGGIG